MKYIVFLLILTVAGHTFGQDSTAVVNKTQIKLKKKAPKKEESKFSNSLNLTMTTDSKRTQEKIQQGPEGANRLSKGSQIDPKGRKQLLKGA